MHLNTQACQHTEAVSAICDWLNDGTAPEDLTLVTDRPWARTYRIQNGGGTRYLKVLPECQAGALAAMSSLSASFPDIVPETLAVEESAGFLLLADHGGKDLGRQATDEQKRSILAAYAKLQASAAGCGEVLSRLPQLDLAGLLPSLLAFLNPQDRGCSVWGPATARDFFDEERCSYYFELLQARSASLAELIQLADRLPLTINHCDLRSPNTALRSDGSVVIFDWDEAVSGPAGLSLHSFFSGCSIPCEMLLKPASAMAPGRASYRSFLSRYIQTLVASGYCDGVTLATGLAGSICAGVVQYLLSYSRFIPADDSYREDIGEILRKRLNDLLDLGDLLQAVAGQPSLESATDYVQRGRSDRAAKTLAKYLENNPFNSQVATQLADLLLQSENQSESRGVYQRLLERNPDQAVLHRHFGLWELQNLEFEAAIAQLTRAVQLGEIDDAIGKALDQAVVYRELCEQAKRSGELPTIRVSPDEQAAGQLNPINRKLAVKLFQTYGTLLIENAFAVPLVERLFEEYLAKYQRYFVSDDHPDALRVGKSRYMITVDVDGAFHSPQLYANPFVEPVISDILGEKMILGGFVSVCSLPGAENMRIHKDHPALFPETDNPDNLPSCAVTAIVPLRGFDKIAGTTRVYKGSHQVASSKAEKMEFQDPQGSRGCCLLMDYRLTHQGRANQSDLVRPILTMIYHRPWFRDIVNYEKQPPLKMTPAAFEQVPEEYKRLFAWAMKAPGTSSSR